MESDFTKHKTICKQNSSVLLYLSTRFNYYNLAEWMRILDQGQIYLNGNKIASDQTISPNDELVCHLPILESQEPKVDINYSIAYEDEFLLCANKSGDIPVHPAGRYRKNTLLSILEKDYSIKLYPCHRLDRETSGLCLFAKSPTSSQKIALQFQSRTIQKEYRVFVYGDFPDSIILEGLIESDPQSSIRKKKYLNQKSFQGKELKTENQISTDFSVDSFLDLKSLKNYAMTRFVKLSQKNGISLLAVFPETGRIHQIRASLFSIGFPVVGDKIYGRDESIFLQFIESGWRKEFYDILGHCRQALHAYRLEFHHPSSDQRIEIISPIPPDLSF